MYSMSKILKVSLSRDKSCVVFRDPFNKNKVFPRKSINCYRPEFIKKLPCFCDCVICEKEVLIRNTSLVITKDKWNSIPIDYRGTYIDYDGHFPELAGRRTVLAGCIRYNGGSTMLIEGVHFIIA